MNGIPPEVLRRARQLVVEPLAPGTYRVTGGSEPHVVDLTGPTGECDCAYRQRGRKVCKHLAAVAIALQLPERR